MIYRGLLSTGAILIILTPFFALPGGVEDMLMQALALIVLILVLVSPKPPKKEVVIDEDE